MKKKQLTDAFHLENSIEKLLMVMKLTFLLAVINILTVTANGYSQATRLSLNMKDATLKEVFSQIELQSSLSFLYKTEVVNPDEKVNITTQSATVSEVLDYLFSNKKIQYEILDNSLIVLMPLNESKQQQKITGTITDATNGEPIIGANVIIEGTTIGTVSDADGKFSIDIPKSDAVLIVSFLGFNTERISVNGQTTISVKLVPDITRLEEVVVIGYGTAKKSDITGSMTILSNDNFNGGIAMAPEQLMQGKVAGVNIIMESGEPGANSQVRVRGGTSINASNNPLYVIDGVPVGFAADGFTNAANDRMTTVSNNPLNMLNPSDIESINVLKDASATAIYGSRGANGVIIVTTKKGKTGKSAVEYEVSMSISALRKKLDMLSADEYRTYMKENATKINGWKDGGADTDWQDKIFRTAITQNHNLSFSGGNDKTNYRASVNYTNQDGIIIASNLEKVTGRINISHKALNDRLTVGLNLTNAMLKNHSVPNPEGAGGAASGGVIRDALRNDPTYAVRDSSGAYIWHGINNQNPVEETLLRSDLTETYRYLGNGTFDYKIFDFLSINTNIGFTKENIDRYVYEPNASRIGAQSHGHASQQSRNNNSKLLETTLVFNKTFGKHSINALGGYSYQEFINKGSYIEATNFISDAIQYNAIDAGDKSSWNLYSYKNSNKIISFYGRATYDLNRKYLLTATIRKDGSSRFGTNQKWGIFPSAALAWRISEEDFMKNVGLISNLKVRIGYGVTGNQDIGNYGSLPILSPGGRYIVGGKYVTAVYPTQTANPDLKWESTRQTNLGLDFGIFHNRLNGTVDLYKKTTTDLLLGFTVPQPAEASNTTLNVGSVENKGIEFELNGVILKNGPLGWEAYANIAHNVNKVVSIANDVWKQEAIYQGWLAVPGFSGVSTEIIKAGLPLGTFYGYQSTGVDANGKQQFLDVSGRDANGKLDGKPDGKILPGDDRVVIGDHQPRFTYGFGTKLTFNKRLSLEVFFRGIQGMKVLNSTYIDLIDKTQMYTALADGARTNVLKDALSNGLAYNETPVYSSQWIQDASFLRLENLTLNYNINVTSLKWLSSLNFYLTGQNLFVITKYKGFDPEIAGGMDSYKYPRPRTIQLGMKVQF